MTQTKDSIRAGLAGATLLAVIWLILSRGDGRSLAVGMPVVLLGTAAYLRLTRSQFSEWRPLGALRLAGYFIWQSIWSGIDVARRVVTPRIPMRAELIRYDLRLRGAPAGVIFANAISLTPGTLSCRLKSDHILVHVLDSRLPIRESLTALEERIAHLYGQSLGPSRDTGTRMHPGRMPEPTA